MEAARDGALEGALDEGGGGEGEDSMAPVWCERLCLEREVWREDSVWEERALDRLEWCE